MNKKDIFDKLVDHLGGGELSTLPQAQELFEIFDILFTPEEAEYALQMPVARTGEISLEDLAQKMGKPIEEVREVVERMARACTVQAIRKGEDNTLYCSAFPLVPGILESAFSKGIDNEKKQRLADGWNKVFPGLWDEMSRSNFPILRWFPINERVDANSQVLAFEDISNIVKKAETLAVIHCHCRTVAEKRCNHIMETCIVLNDWAEYLIQYQGARRWTVKEVLQRLKECEEDGLVHMAGNTTEGNDDTICNCCPCCCGALSAYVENRDTHIMARSNFEPKVDHEACTLCLSCNEICPTKAIMEVSEKTTSGTEARIIVQESQCIGCGLCSTHCPEDAIHMKKVRDVMPPKTDLELMEKYFAGMHPEE